MDVFEYRIYKIVNDVDDMVYIGSTKQLLRNRYDNHCAKLSYRTSKLYTHMNKLGRDHFDILLIDTVECTKLDACKLEQTYIDTIHEDMRLNSQRAHRTSTEKQQEKRDWNKLKYERVKNTDEFKQTMSEYNKQRWVDIKSDPIKYAEHTKRLGKYSKNKNEKARTVWAIKMQDPAFRDEHNRNQREYYRKRKLAKLDENKM